ncbi:class II glutamine amidotransferase [Stigmatella aurantiaca]|uniref:Class II glutamine amidotransferase domain protein n=1 Tax=Stigmatella aurantiaca (strain DW4/3-1) TaxID=378806 RepID=Q08QI1_STIAD|nr:class II glutamine amidotransferase [Stigmatella aurantiaca]ADO72507.1 Class II glutamine amidotransferase domain protein [Stigmatella aurantiaca DW4/3-1]EAU62741.1 class II glutamine amidotransferase, putative [Stigmatella aurantiaca DW4/3-1]
MCRLFGFRSTVPTAVHPSLVTEKNSLVIQSREHKDGWGIAAYGAEALPRVAHGVGAAHSDPDFHRVSSLVSSHTVVAHVRLASVGAVEMRNSHPFLHGRWSFVHNGTVQDFPEHQKAIESLIHPDLRVNIRGTTDSERCLYLFLTRLSARSSEEAPARVGDVARALAETMQLVAGITDKPGRKRSAMNFLVTDGQVMVATRRHRSLFISDGRRSACGGTSLRSGTRLEQLIIASEALCGDQTGWDEVAEEEIIGVDGQLVLNRWSVAELTQSN